MTWLYPILSVLLVSGASLAGLATFSIDEKRIHRTLFFLIALSVGALFGDVFIHLLPELYIDGAHPVWSSIFIIVGIVIFFVLEKFFHWEHHHAVDECREEGHIHPVGKLNLLSDGIHNFLDGLIIGVSYLASPAIGLASTLAVVLHEIPQEIGDFGILLHAGYSRGQALLLNFASALVAVLGVLAALIIGGAMEILMPVMLPIAAGGFIYIAGSDLVPELHKTVDIRKSAIQLLAMLLGIGLMLLLLLLE